MKFSTYSCIEVQYNDSVRNKTVYFSICIQYILYLCIRAYYIRTYIRKSISGMPFELYIHVFTHTVRTFKYTCIHTCIHMLSKRLSVKFDLEIFVLEDSSDPQPPYLEAAAERHCGSPRYLCRAQHGALPGGVGAAIGGHDH